MHCILPLTANARVKCYTELPRRILPHRILLILTPFNLLLSTIIKQCTFRHFLYVIRIWHSEHRASWCVLIMKADEMNYFLNLFDKVLHMFRTCPLSIIRSISTLYTSKIFHSSSVGTTLADANRTSMKNIYYVHTVLRYSWWWTVGMSETCRVLYQINLRKSASHWLSL